MKGMTRIFSVITAVIMLFCITACGKDEGGGSYYGPGQNGGAGGSDQTFSEPSGMGFSQNHAVEAGFGIGMDTLEDIIGRYGQPIEQTTDEYTSVTISSAVYDFGRFEFEGAPGTVPVLTYVQIYSGKAAPCGIEFGANMEDAANKIFTGSGTGLCSAPEQQLCGYTE